jgi:uncharacterized protein YoxC
MIFEICASIVAIILLILAIYIIQTLKQLQKTLKHINSLAQMMEPKISEGSLETLKFLHSSNDLIKRVNSQLNDFNPLLKCISDTGCIIQKAINSWQNNEQIKILPDSKKKLQREKLEKIIEFIALGILFWQQIKKKG